MKELLEGQALLLRAILSTNLNAILIAPPGQGKSALIKSLTGSVVSYDDITGAGLVDLVSTTSERVIAISDLNKIAEREKASNPFSIMLTVIEEGFAGKKDARRDIKLDNITKNIVCAITTDIWHNNLKEKFKRTGMESRLIPIAWKYNDTELKMINTFLLRNYNENISFEIEVPETIIPNRENYENEQRVLKIMEVLVKNPRVRRNFVRLLNAVSHINNPQSDIITDRDVDLTLCLLVFTDYENISSPLRFFLISTIKKIKDYSHLISKYSKSEIEKEYEYIKQLAKL
jgi:hypothetical protein